jgi:hypothetical protein
VSLCDLVIGSTAFVGSFVAISGVYVALYATSFAVVIDYSRREVFGRLPELFTPKYAPPVSHKLFGAPGNEDLHPSSVSGTM